ncbi:hypothetical protein [Avibacterium avium]|uniref:hypothetical protein n=1 Tax=Avibacterium avium TaxID=751 RepID=UPI003BF7B6E7
MFLNQLSDQGARTLFLELAVMVAMIEGNKQSMAKQVADNMQGRKDYISPYATFIDDLELIRLEEYTKELSYHVDESDDFHDFLYDILSKKGRYYNYLGREEETLKSLFNKGKEKILDEYKNNSNIKQDILNKLVGEGIDLLSLDKNVMENLILELAEIKMQVFLKVLEYLVKERACISRLTEKDKKIIIFELIGMGLSNNNLDEKEFLLIQEIAKLFDIDAEYLEEFKDLVKVIYKVQKEASDLINE